MKRILFLFLCFVLLPGFASAQTCQELIRQKAFAYLTAVAAYNAATDATRSSLETDRNAELSRFKDFFNLRTQPECIVEAIASAPVERPTISEIDWKELSAGATAVAKAAFQQDTASTGGGSTTNAISGPITSQILSVAESYGGITESTSGQNTTLSGNLFNLSLLLLHTGLPACKNSTEFVEATTKTMRRTCIPVGSLTGLDRISFALSFPVSQPSTTVSAAGGSSSTPSSFTNLSQLKGLNQVKITGVILRGKAATADTLAKAFSDSKSVPSADLVKQNRESIATAIGYQEGCDKPGALGICGWILQMEEDLSKLGQELSGPNPKTPDELANNYVANHNFHDELLQHLAVTHDSSNVTLANKYLAAAALYKAKLNSLVDGLRKPVVTAEYDANFPASQPSNSVFRLIAAPSLPAITLTLNGAASWYNGNPSSTVPGSRILRDFQFAGEISHTFNSSTKVADGVVANGVGNMGTGKMGSLLGQSTISAAYYYQDQTAPSILTVTPGQPVSGVTFTNLPSGATQVFAQRGVINLAQGKFTFIPGKSGINIPVAVTWSNRTELVTQPSWRSQIGISYDFTSLFGKSSSN